LLAETSDELLAAFHQLTVKDGLLHNSILTLAEDGKGDVHL